MKILKFTAIIVITMLISCGGDISKQVPNAKGFGVMEKEIKSKFGNNAYYTDLKILYIKGLGNTISTTVTNDPESLKMGQWNLVKGTWKQHSEISLEVPKGTKAADFMFQLNKKINLEKLGELTEKSMKQLKAEKKIKNPILSMAYVKFPKNGDLSKTEYTVKLEPENEGTSFTFFYKLNGELIKIN